MIERHVNCIRRSHMTAQHEHVTHIGNSVAGWQLSREVAIVRTEASQEAYYTVHPATGKRIYLGVVREPGKPAYLRARLSGQWTDHLLALGDCGAQRR